MYIAILSCWLVVSLIWWMSIGLIGITELDYFRNKKRNYPEFISIWRCLAIGYLESKDDCNILGKVCITLLVAMLYLPVLPFYSLISFIGFVLYKLFTWKPKIKN